MLQAMRFRLSTKGRAAFTLAEVMIALAITTFVCLSAFALMYQLSKITLRDAYRAEAYRVAQQKIEELRGGDVSAFTASGATTITSSMTTVSSRNTLAQFAYAAVGQTQRVNFTRTVASVSSSSTFIELNVNVTWTFDGQTFSIAVPIARGV